MTLSNPITMFGIHQATIEDRETFDRSTLKILGSAEFTATQPLVNLNGGSQPFPWGSEAGYTEATLDLTVKQYDLSVLKYFNPYLAASISENTSGDAAGATANFANLEGTSVVNATTGVASAAIISAATPKYGSYIVKAASATTVDFYTDNDLDGATMVNDLLKITSTPVTVPGSGATVDETVSGVELTGGSGSIAMTTGDMARLDVRPINSYNYTYTGGQTGQVFKEFALTVFGEKIEGNKYRVIHFPRVKASGMNFSFNEKDWSTFTTSITVLYDPVLNYSYKVQIVGR